MEDIGTNINSPTLMFSLVSQGHETSIAFVDVLLPDKRFSIIYTHEDSQGGIYFVKYALIMCYIIWVYNRHYRTQALSRLPDRKITQTTIKSSDQSVNNTCSIWGGTWKQWRE